MLTRCPHCQTNFRVTPEQLKARRGQVRCGACRDVFSALESLADELPAVPAVPAETPPEPVRSIEPEAESEPAILTVPQDDSPPLPYEPASDDEESRRDRRESPLRDWQDEMPRSGDGDATTEAVVAPAVADEPPTPIAWTIIAETPPPRRWPSITALVILLALALGQLIFSFRVELAVLVPELRPVLVAVCEELGCTLPRPSKAELIGIETSDLAPAYRERLLLTATLKNRAPFDQEYPHLELTLTDTQDRALLRKVLAPADYLPAERGVDAGFASNADIAVRLTLETTDLPASGYRLYLFYP